MALSGSLSSSDYKGRYIKFSWTAKQDTTNNQSTISWSLVGDGEASSGWYYSGNFKVVIDGDEVYSSSTRIKLYDGTSITSGSKTIKHNSDGSRSFSVSIKAGIYTVAVNCTGSKTFTLDQIPRAATISSAPNFTDEGNPVLKYNNAAGSSVSTLQACIASSDGETTYAAYRDISKTGSSYTFNLTDAERETLRKACTTAKTMTVRFYVKTVIGGNTYKKYLSKTLTITNANPTFNPSITPTTESVDITGSEDILIRYFSDIKYIFNATAKKHATIKSYKITSGNLTGTSASGVLSNVTNGSFTMTVTDSRGYTATQTITKRLVNYVKPTCAVDYDSPLADGSVRLLIDGNYFNGSLGATPNVSLLQYRYREQNGEWSAWQTATPTFSSNKYSADIQITGLDYRKVYDLQAKITDVLNSATSNTIVVRFLPLFDWGEDDFSFNVNVNLQNNLKINGITTEGEELNAFQPCNGNNNCVVGYGGYTNQVGATNLYGHDVNVLTNTDFTVNDGDKVYSLLGLAKAMTTNYVFDCDVTLGDNYESGSASANMIGNNLRMYMTAKRKSNASEGDITNETIMKIKISHEGKIGALYAVGIINATTGAPASMYSNAGGAVDDGQAHEFEVSLTGVGVADNEWSAYWIIPARIVLSAYV